jgi:hypothetical protein
MRLNTTTAGAIQPKPIAAISLQQFSAPQKRPYMTRICEEETTAEAVTIMANSLIKRGKGRLHPNSILWIFDICILVVIQRAL